MYKRNVAAGATSSKTAQHHLQPVIWCTCYHNSRSSMDAHENTVQL